MNSEETAGTVAYTTPRQEGALEGSTITIHISNGSEKNQPGTSTTSPATTTKPSVKPPTTIDPNCPPWNPKYPNCGGR